MSRLIGFVIVAVAVCPALLAGQKTSETLSEGRSAYVLYCASCHGDSGRGNGPAALEFKRRPADLTQFARQNGGVFNDVALRRIVDGRTVKAHGTFEMPVWGDAFKWREGLSEEAIRARIEAIVGYIASIQERAGH